MRKILKWRYYCEHCKKSGASGGHIAKHEKHCTANPARECRMCQLGGLAQQSIDTLIVALANQNIDDLRVVADGCPACMLAAIVQDRKRRGVARFDESEEWNTFDYMAAAKLFMDDACAVVDDFR